jgi:hypothetical protein
MAATTSGYGAYNPAAVDPYPIESDLAKLAVGNSPENAANLLDLYQLQRTTDAANYGHEMGIQHDFARQQLAQQLKETYLKNAMDAVKTRGGLSVYNQLAPEAQISPDIAGPIETGLSNAQDAATAEKAGSAAYHGVQAGTPPNMDVLRRVSGGMFDTAGIPLQLQVQAAKNAGHEGGGGGGKRQKINIPMYYGDDGNGNQVHAPLQVYADDPPEVVAAKGRAAREQYKALYPPGSKVPGATPPANVGDDAPNDQKPGPRVGKVPLTNLGNNPAPPATGSGPRAASAEFIRDPKVQNAAKERFKLLTPGEQQAIKGNIKGVMPVVKLQGGGLGYVGPNGNITVMP